MSSTAAEVPPGRTVMRKYVMHMSEDDIMGEGTSSICRRGTNMETFEQVAIKVYKVKSSHSKRQEDEAAVMLTKFRRQIEVLKELQKPLEPPEDTTLWSEQLAQAGSARLFMQLIDYSKDDAGEPGPDHEDGVLYVITEIASYSLKDFLRQRREQRKPLSRETVRSITKAIILVTAGLHAKGLIHLDLKPENLMVFNGVLKLIDVDGCVKMGSKISITDSSLSFSPCYCAPEWANFLIEESEDPHIVASPSLDVWSIGMTLCDLVILDAALKATYGSFMRHGRSNREAGFLFMDWLSRIQKPPVPRQVEKFDQLLLKLLTDNLLVCDPAKRMTLAQSLRHPFVSNAALRNSRSVPLTYIPDSGAYAPQSDGSTAEPTSPTACSGLTSPAQAAGRVLPEEVQRHRRFRVEDQSNGYLHKGLLWKLNTDGDPKDEMHWLKRDMWIASNCSLCYFSHKESKRLVLLDAHHLATATVTRFAGGAKEPAFKILSKPDHDDPEAEELDTHIFACESEEEYIAWVSAYEKIKTEVVKTMALGADMAYELREFRLAVRNRRLKVGTASGVLKKDDFDPVFKARLWKVKADGDREKEADWFEREMWISRNGSLVYWSKKEERELVYYTGEDVARATIMDIPNASSFRPWAFQVMLAPVDGVEFAPGEFAAESEEMRERWVAEFGRFTQRNVA